MTIELFGQVVYRLICCSKLLVLLVGVVLVFGMRPHWPWHFHRLQRHYHAALSRSRERHLKLLPLGTSRIAHRKTTPSSSLLVSLLRFFLSRFEDLPHITLASDPLLHFDIELAKLFLLRVRFLEECFLALLQGLSLIFQLLPRCVLVLNARNGQVMFVTIRMFWVCSEKLLGCCEW